MKVDAFSFYVASSCISIKRSLRRTLVHSGILLSKVAVGRPITQKLQPSHSQAYHYNHHSP